MVKEDLETGLEDLLGRSLSGGCVVSFWRTPEDAGNVEEPREELVRAEEVTEMGVLDGEI